MDRTENNASGAGTTPANPNQNTPDVQDDASGAGTAPANPKKSTPDMGRTRDECTATIPAFINRYQLEEQVHIVDYELKIKIDDIPDDLGSTPSICYPLNFLLKNGQKSAVVFKVPQMGSDWPVGREWKVYEKEKFMHEEVLLWMRWLWPRNEPLAFPRSYAASTTGVLLILEHLERFGFERPTISLDLARIWTVLKSLAHFHATSVVLLYDYHQTVSTRMAAITPATVLDDGATGHYDAESAAFRQHIFPLIGEEGRQAFNAFFADYPETVNDYNRSYLIKGRSINVILHGDLTLENILFRGDNECRFINFHVSRCGPPVIDLVTFLMSSVKLELVDEFRDVLFDLYVNEFNRVLRYTNRKYTADALRSDLNAYKRFLIYNLITIANSWTCSELASGGTDYDTCFRSIVSSEKYRATVTSWLRYLKFQ